VGKVTKTQWDGQNLLYEAEIYDEDTAAKIRKGLIRHVSVGADYETIDLVSGKVPHGLFNAEMSLVAVPGVAETNIQILEKLHLKEQEFEPILAGEYTLGFYQDTAAFMPEHFSTVWLDRENGVLAMIGKPKDQPELQRTQAIYFSKQKMWDQNKIRDWLQLHPSYMTPISSQTPQNPAMLSVPAESIEPQINPNNIKLRGVGSVDLQAIKKGLRAPSLKIAFPLPSDAPINFLQYAILELAKSLSVQVLYYKGAFATDIISLLYTGCKFQTTTVECSIET
jgi:hypothetical protein